MQLGYLLRGILQLPSLALQVAQALLEAFEAREKFALVDIAFRVAVEEPAAALVKALDLGPQGLCRGTLLGPGGGFQTTLIFRQQTLRIFQERRHFRPDRQFQSIGAHLGIIANALPAKPVSIRPDTTVIGVIAPFALARTQTDGLAVEGVTAAGTAYESLQQIADATLTGAGMASVLLQLFLHDFVQRFIHDRRHRNADPLLPGSVIDALMAPGLGLLAAHRPQSWPCRANPRLAECRPAAVGRILEQPPDAGPVPNGFAGGT